MNLKKFKVLSGEMRDFGATMCEIITFREVDWEIECGQWFLVIVEAAWLGFR